MYPKNIILSCSNFYYFTALMFNKNPSAFHFLVSCNMEKEVKLGILVNLQKKIHTILKNAHYYIKAILSTSTSLSKKKKERKKINVGIQFNGRQYYKKQVHF